MARLLGALARPMPTTQQMFNIKDIDHKDDRVYRWAREEPGRLDYLRSMGYRVEKSTKGGDPGSPDGAIRLGRMIYMSCPKSEHDERRMQLKRYNDAVIDSPRDRFKNAAASAGVVAEDSTRIFRAPMSAVTNKEA